MLVPATEAEDSDTTRATRKGVDRDDREQQDGERTAFHNGDYTSALRMTPLEHYQAKGMCTELHISTFCPRQNPGYAQLFHRPSDFVSNVWWCAGVCQYLQTSANDDHGDN